MRLTKLLLLAVVALPAAAWAQEKGSAMGQSINPVRVALFAEAGCTDAKSREAVFKVLSGRRDIKVEKVTSDTVRSPGFMASFDVFLLPGGTGSGEANAVGVDAGKRIADDIRSGKGLVAICAGGYYIADGGSEAGRALDIISADNHDGEHWARGEGMIAVEVLGLKEGETSRTMWYENGPIFKPMATPGLQAYTPLVRYNTDMAAEGAPTGQMAGRDAAIAAPYGQGRVVAFGPHPELSPQVKHWLINAIKWAAAADGSSATSINAQSVLEGDTHQ